MAVTLKDIANACGVSYSTVSKALKNSPLVTAETTERIQQKAKEMNYIPNNSARSLVSNKSQTIGLIWPSVDRVAVSTLVSEINNFLKNTGYFMSVSIDDVETAAHKFLELRFDGIIVFDEGEASTLPSIISSNIPVVAYGTDRKLEYPIVNVNHKHAMILLLDDLMQNNITNICYIGDLNTDDIRQIIKKETFEHYCKEHHLNYNMIDSKGLSAEDTFFALKSYLTNHTLPEGIICGSYDITLGLIHTLKDSLDQHIVYSYDNVPQFDHMDTVIHSVGVPTKKIAETLVNILINAIEYKENQPDVYHLEPELVKRK
ncbi:LacI family DNA-binding transcriptional regulator [Mammaliicoccus sciuri]|uniref:LacI family DNA-binding transcriptional regulator n=1 Tax=Mammaliicoccus sciuri TaxID=1296 RepID=UPI001E59C8CE|nr:LacI family DNA-binding transcriptional regulator [Mammaliicoccus sciuri]MCD8896604.1 LacI family DNA-binding transcriptional regulator [Mammaliicoccus sciuri]